MEHQIGDIIGNRFRITGILGQGGVAITYSAIDEQSQQEVALKALSLRYLQEWKALELFQREAETLKQLDHPDIPLYIDYVEMETERDRRFYLAQQLVEGNSLAQLIAQGWQPNLSELKYIAEQVLNVLSYLHNLPSPVIHRDIKPENLIRQASGRILVVDFGAVQDVYRQTQYAGSTFVGTYGYMAPEQYHRNAQPATDLYALGVTLLHLYTGKFPATFPQTRLKIDFRPQVDFPASFADWLEQMLEPAVEDRFTSAEVALDTLVHPFGQPNQTQVLSPPAGSSIQLKRTANSLATIIPATGFNQGYGIALGIGLILTLPFAFTISLTLFGILSFDVALVYTGIGMSFVFGLFALGGAGLIQITIQNICLGTSLIINRDHFTLTRQWQFLGVRYRKETRKGKTKDLVKVEKYQTHRATDGSGTTTYFTHLYLYYGVYCYRIVTGKTNAEQAWLEEQINQFLQSI